MKYFADRFEQLYRIEDGKDWYMERYNPFTGEWEETPVIASSDDELIENDIKSISQTTAEYAIKTRYKSWKK